MSAPATSASWASIAALDAASVGVPAACVKNPRSSVSSAPLACRSSTVASGDCEPGPATASRSSIACGGELADDAVVGQPGLRVLGLHVQVAERRRRDERERVQLRAQVAQRLQQLAVLRAEMGGLDDGVRTAAHQLGDVVAVGEAHHAGDRGDLGGRGAVHSRQACMHLVGAVEGEEQRAGVEVVGGVQRELDAR